MAEIDWQNMILVIEQRPLPRCKRAQRDCQIHRLDQKLPLVAKDSFAEYEYEPVDDVKLTLN